MTTQDKTQAVQIRTNLTKAIKNSFKNEVRNNQGLSPFEINQIYHRHLKTLLETMEGNNYNETYLMQTLLAL